MPIKQYTVLQDNAAVYSLYYKSPSLPYIFVTHIYILRYSQEKTAEEFVLSIVSRYIITLFVPFLFEIGDKDLKLWLFQSPCYAVVQAKLPT